MKRQVDYIVTLPRHIRVKDVNVKSIPIDDTWETIVKDGNRHIATLPYKLARQKFG